MIEFKHPIDAMRAKITGDLDCSKCRQWFDDYKSPWCRRHETFPNGAPEWYCPDFQLPPPEGDPP